MKAPNGQRVVPATCLTCEKGFTAKWDYDRGKYAQFCSRECNAHSNRVKDRKSGWTVYGSLDGV